VTARVMLDLAEGEDLDETWLADLLRWELPWSAHSHKRCRALVFLVAAHHTAACEQGPRLWPTLPDLATTLGSHAVVGDIVMLLTVAVAGGWLRYVDVP
jgi:hypothetical protein